MEQRDVIDLDSQFEAGKKKLPNAVAVLVLGIISIVICYLGVITGTIALALASKDMKLYRANPGAYDEGSYKNLNAGKICAIIGVCLSALIILFYAVIFITAISTANSLKNSLEDYNYENYDSYDDDYNNSLDALKFESIKL